jgi:hypothetical protein
MINRRFSSGVSSTGCTITGGGSNFCRSPTIFIYLFFILRIQHIRGAHAEGDCGCASIDVPAPASDAVVFDLGVAAVFAVTDVRIIYLQRKKFCLFPKGADQSGPTAHAAQSAASVNAELSEVLRTEVGQLMLLPVRPQILDRI